jgi:predicted permease
MPFEQFIIFFLLLLTGFFCKKYGVFSDSAVSGINKFIVNIGYPCLILVRTTALDMDHRIFGNFALTFLISLGFLLLYGVYARFYCRGKRFPDEDKPVAELSIMSSNNGFIGLPVAFSFFGDLGLFYMVACNIALNTTSYTYGIAQMNRGRTSNEPLNKKVKGLLLMFVSPKVSVPIAGIVLCYNHIALPPIADEFCGVVGAAATPMAMISIGTMLAGNFSIHSFRKRVVMETVLNRLFITPLICAAIIWRLPLDMLAKKIILLSNALPVAAIVAILCERYDRNKYLAGETIVISTLFSMATVPLVIWLMQIYFY